MIGLLEQQIRPRLVNESTPTKAYTMLKFVNFDTYTLITNANRSRCTLHTCTFNHIYVKFNIQSSSPRAKGDIKRFQNTLEPAQQVEVFRSVQTVFLN